MNKKALAILATAILASAVAYSIFNNAHGAMPADSMFVDPSTISFTTATATVGTKFNVTVWLNLTTAANSWQFYITYDKSQLNATRCGYTGNGKSQWSKALPVNTVEPAFGEHNATHNYILHGEALKSSAVQTGAGSLSWVELEIIKAPPSGQTLASELRLDLIGPFNSQVLDADFNPITVNFGKALYSFASTQPPPANFTLTITATTGGTTNPAPGTYTHTSGTNVSVTALPDATHDFDHWDLDAVNIGAANPTKVTMDKNHTLNAAFVAIPPQVNYTLTITATAGGTTNPAPGKYTYKNGTEVSVNAIANANFGFDHWKLDAANVSTNPIIVKMNANHTLNAVFTAVPQVNYTLTITAGAGGTTNPAPGTYSYKAGTGVSVQALPDATHNLDHWELDTANMGATSPIVVTMNKNHTLNAVFVSKPPVVNYTLTIIATAGGTTNPAPGTYTHTSGTNVSVTALPDATHDFDHWELDSVNIGATNPTKVTMNQNHTLQADFVSKPPLAATVDTCNSTGAEKHIFSLGQTVYAKGSGYSPSTDYSIYIVKHVAAWIDGMQIPTRVIETAMTVPSDPSGNIMPTAVWNPPLTPGKYDVVIDVNGNGKYDAGIDALDNNKLDIAAGLLVVPEFWLGTILGLAGCFAAFGIFRMTRRKHAA